MKTLKMLLTIIIMLVLFGCSDHQSKTEAPSDLGDFRIHNAVLYYLEDDCWQDYGTSEGILWNCEHVLTDETWFTPPDSYNLLDVHVTDEMWNAKYINIEIRDEQYALQWGLSVFDYEIEFLNYPGTQYAVGVIIYVPVAIKSGIHTVDIWLVGHDGRKTDVYTVEIEIE